MADQERERLRLKAAALRLKTTQGAPDLGVTPPQAQPSGLPPAGMSLAESAKYALSQDLGQLQALGTGLAESLSFGMDDPIAGVVNYLLGNAESVGQGIEQNVALKEQLGRDYPGASTVGKVAGFAVPATAVETALAKASGPAANAFTKYVAQPFIAGAATSGLTSAGEDVGEGRMPDSVLSDALLGGGASALGSSVIAGVPKAVKSALPLLGVGTTDAAKQAAAQRLISEAGGFAGLGRRVVNPDDMTSVGGFQQGALEAQIAGARPEATLGDLNQYFRNEMIAAASNRRAAPEALGALSRTMQNRQEQFVPLVREGIQKILPDYVSTAVHKEGMQAALAPLQRRYDTVLDTAPPTLDRQSAYELLDDFLPPGTNETAAVRSQLRAVIDRTTTAGKDAAGKPVLRPMTARELLSLKKQADDIYERLSAEDAGASTKEAARAALTIKNEISGILDARVPGYSDVANRYADPLTFAEMRRKGSDAAKKAGTVEDLTDFLDTLRPAEADAFKEGYRDALQSQIERGEVSFLRRVEGGSTRDVQRLRVLFGDKVVDDLTRFANEVDAMRKTTTGALSATKSAQLGSAAAQGAEGVAQFADIADVLAGIGSAGIANLPGASARRAATATEKGQRAVVSNQIAEWMSAQGPQQMQQALDEIFTYLRRADPSAALPRRALGQSFSGLVGPQ